MTTIDQAAAALEAAKIAEAAATAARIDAEQALVALVEGKPEGSVTVRGEHCKATVTFAMNRTVDQSALSEVLLQVSREIAEKAFRWKPEVNTTGLRYLQNNEPEIYAVVAEAITARPGKPSVRIEAVESVARAA